MAIKNIEMEEFRSKEKAIYNLHPKTMISGKNGAGKSSIKEALAFVLCGTDSLGGKNPQHLIRREADDKATMKVRILTDKAEIQRSLTRKGNGSIKIIREGVPTTVTQTQLEGMLGPIDVVLSAMIPGYFLGLSAERQSKALADILPEVDREALFEEVAGFPLTKEEVLRYGLKRRFDLIAAAVAQDRRDLEKELARKEGELEGMKNLKPVEEPQEPAAIATLSRLNALSREWEDYERKMREYTNYKVRYDRVVDENKRREDRRSEIKAIINTLKEVPPMVVDDISVQVQELLDKKLPMPQPPTAMDLPSGDHCSTCGQVVGAKHREKVTKQNEESIAEYERQKQEAVEHNSAIQEKINAIYQKENEQKTKAKEIEDENNFVRQKKKKLEIELASLRPDELPSPMDLPEAPEEEFDVTARDRAADEVDEYRAKKREYVRYLEAKKIVDESSDGIKGVTESLTKEIEHLKELEKYFKLMPEMEMKKQAEFLSMPHVTFEITDRIVVSREEVPYGLLSTGYQMRADIEICLKFNELMKRPMNVIFVDNVDLIDSMIFEKDSPIQWFVAKVDGDHDQVMVKEF